MCFSDYENIRKIQKQSNVNKFTNENVINVSGRERLAVRVDQKGRKFDNSVLLSLFSCFFLKKYSKTTTIYFVNGHSRRSLSGNIHRSWLVKHLNVLNTTYMRLQSHF